MNRHGLIMSSVGYDLDTSGGLMPLIRALTKPPDEDLNPPKQKRSQHPYYRRPGKGHNHDSCDACEEGGDLICCDRCPASFHLGCHDPPLEEGDIPHGQWLCKECRSAEVDKTSSTKSSRAASPADSGDKKSRARSVRASSSSSKKSDKEKLKVEQEKEAECEMSPLDILLKAARIMNPKQFDIPREMHLQCPFPGTDKADGSDCGVVSVDSAGCVPLPAKLCFACGLNCKMAPLIQCDYCPLLFHQDCLDPPLTALPSGRWMCPNHVEQYIDWKLVNSVSATERVALWDKFSGPIDQHAVKIDFIRKAKNSRPPFRIKVRTAGVQGRACVPPMVKYHYKHPPPLLPSRREYVRCKKYLLNHPEYREEPVKRNKKHIICMNLSCPLYLTPNGVCSHESWMLEGAGDIEKEEDLHQIEEGEKRGLTEEATGGGEEACGDNKRRRVSSDDDGIKIADEADSSDPRPFVALKDVHGNASQVVAAVDRHLQKLDDRLIRLLAYQRLQQLASEDGNEEYESTALSEEAAAVVVSSIDRSALRQWGYGRPALPPRMLPPPARRRIAAAVWGRTARAAPPPQRVAKAAISFVSTDESGLGDGIGRPIPMRLSRLTIGWADHCDVVLSRFGHCQYVSPLHAVIFYDEVSRYFELMNYSEFGSRVNGALYTCELGGSEPPVEAPTLAVRNLISKKHKKINRESDLPEGGEMIGAAQMCCCPRPSDAAGAWEGAALLQHGSVIHFGCLMFVFSIMDSLAQNH